jgi:hypothetical protein
MPAGQRELKRCRFCVPRAELQTLSVRQGHGLAETASFDLDRNADGEAPVARSNHLGLVGLSDCRRVDKDASPYTDLALTPVQPEDMDALEMFTVTTAAKSTIEKERRKRAARAKGTVSAAQL